MGMIKDFFAIIFGALGTGFSSADDLAKKFICASLLVALTILSGAVAIWSIDLLMTWLSGLFSGVSSAFDSMPGLSEMYDSVMPATSEAVASPTVTSAGDVPLPDSGG